MKDVLKAIAAGLLWLLRQLKAWFTLDLRLAQIEANQKSVGAKIGQSIEQRIVKATAGIQIKIRNLRSLVAKKTDSLEKDFDFKVNAFRRELWRLRKDLKGYHEEVRKCLDKATTEIATSNALAERLTSLEGMVEKLNKKSA